MEVPDVMTVDEAASTLRISTKTLRSIIRDGDLPIVWVRGSIRITSVDLSNYIRKGGSHHHDG